MYQYHTLVHVGELQCLGLAVAKISNIATRFIIPSEDPILNMTNVSAGTHPTRAQSNVHVTMKEVFIARFRRL
jgi:hypothetical protein